MNEGGPPLDPPANDPGGVGDIFCDDAIDGGSITSPLSIIASLMICLGGDCGLNIFGTRGPATKKECVKKMMQIMKCCDK